MMEKAYVTDFIDSLPDGVNTVVGDNAARLSVGQAQRIAVARALLNPCHLLLLDEPSASLDAHSEERVMHALNEAAHQQTTLLVTHLLEETRDYDEVWVMDKGLIIEQGSYAALQQQQGAFAQLLSHRTGICNHACFTAVFSPLPPPLVFTDTRDPAGDCHAARQYRAADAVRLVPRRYCHCRCAGDCLF